jgi:hypothetical protein
MSDFLGELNVKYGCTDGGCPIGRRRGMHTNSGCHCLNGLRPEQRVRVRAALYLLREEIERLRDMVSRDYYDPRDEDPHGD